MGREARLNKQYRDRGQEPPWIAAAKQKRQATGSFDQYRLENLDKQYLDSLPADERQAYLDRCFCSYALQLHITEDQFSRMTQILGQSPAGYLRAGLQTPDVSGIAIRLHAVYAEVAFGGDASSSPADDM